MGTNFFLITLPLKYHIFALDHIFTFQLRTVLNISCILFVFFFWSRLNFQWVSIFFSDHLLVFFLLFSLFHRCDFPHSLYPSLLCSIKKFTVYFIHPLFRLLYLDSQLLRGLRIILHGIIIVQYTLRKTTDCSAKRAFVWMYVCVWRLVHFYCYSYCNKFLVFFYSLFISIPSWVLFLFPYLCTITYKFYICSPMMNKKVTAISPFSYNNWLWANFNSWNELAMSSQMCSFRSIFVVSILNHQHNVCMCGVLIEIPLPPIR